MKNIYFEQSEVLLSLLQIHSLLHELRYYCMLCSLVAYSPCDAALIAMEVCCCSFALTSQPASHWPM